MSDGHRERLRASAAPVASIILLLAACTASVGSGGGGGAGRGGVEPIDLRSSQPRDSASSVRVLVTWTGSEAEAFQAVLRPFEDRTGIRVDTVTTRDLHGAIADGLTGGDPPDIVGVEGPAHLRELANQDALVDLGTVVDIGQYKASVAPTFVELGSVNGTLRGVFLKATVKGLLWYNPSVFRLGVPATYADLQWMADRYLTPDTREWCVGLASRESSGWPGTDLVESFLIHQSGVDAYDRWVRGELPWSSPEVHAAFESFGRVVADDAVHGGVRGALETPFETAGDPLFSDPPGCVFLHQGSFMPAFFDAGGHAAGADYDFIPFPSMGAEGSGAVIGAGDLFGMLTHDQAAQELMRYLVGVEAQEAMVSGGAALSVDARVAAYPNDVVRREALLLTSAAHFRFDASDMMPPAVNAAFWQAILDFTADQSRLEEILDRLDSAAAEVRSDG